MKWTRWVEIARYLNPRFWIRLADEFQWRTDDLRALRRRVDAIDFHARHFRDDLIAAEEIIGGRGTAAGRMVRPEGFLHEEAILLGSGPGLLELTEKEKDHIRSQATIGMNRFYMFDDVVGITPGYVFIADYSCDCPVFYYSCKKALEADRPPTFLLESYYRLMAPPGLQTLYFHRPDGSTNLNWATQLDAPLFNHRGSLSSLLNLCGVLRIAPHIRLVGVDLDRPGYFFESRRNQFPQLFESEYAEAVRSGLHPTMVPVPGMGKDAQDSILTYWPKMMQALAATGIRVTCPRKDNVLVRNGLCEFDPIPGGESGGSETRNPQRN